MNKEVWRKASELAERGSAFCLTVVAETSGSVPRRAGSVMIVMSDGTTAGTVGGGNIERQIALEAAGAIEDRKTYLKSFSLDDPEGKDTASVCGGNLTILFLPHAARMTLHVFGAGHVARPTARLGAMTGYNVIVYDKTDQFATPQNFPEAARFIIGDLKKSVREIEFGEKDAIVILTGSHAEDFEILQQFKGNLPPYLGIIASKKKAVHFREKLLNDGWKTEDVEAIHTPIGLQINARTPEEIAVSIMSEIISLRGPIE